MIDISDEMADDFHYTNTIRKNLNKYRKLYYPFQAMFKFKLSEVWINHLIGLDIIKLDEKLGVPDGTSTKDYIEQVYGEAAVKLIMSLM